MGEVSVLPGQIWKDNDPRINRTIVVIIVEDDYATCMNQASGKLTKIRLDRFKSDTRGYSLISGC